MSSLPTKVKVTTIERLRSLVSSSRAQTNINVNLVIGLVIVFVEEINVSGFDYCQKRDKVTFNK